MIYLTPYTSAEITPEATLAELGLDALHIMSVAHDIETDLGVDIPDAVVERWQYVSDIQRTVEALQCAY